MSTYDNWQQEKQDVSIFEREADLLRMLALENWVPPTDPDERALTAMILESQVNELRPYVHGLHASRYDQGWTEERTWETFGKEDTKELRKSFLAACVRKMVEPDQLSDLKRRWESASFTSVTKAWYVLGSVHVPRPLTCTLPLKDEVDIEGDGADVGRQSLTYLEYQKIKGSVDAVRLKIDGDRFVVQKRGEYWYLVGYEEIRLFEKPTFSVLERYAGEFYVIYPYNHPDQRVKAEIKGKSSVLQIRSHPWFSKEKIPESDLYRSRYEGVMLLSSGKEYRSKWVETAEVLLNDEVWEVSYSGDTMHLMRPRPGKVALPEKTAKMRLGAAIPGRPLFKALTVTAQTQFSVKREMKGSKVLFLSEKSFWLIRDGMKPLDLVGGTCLDGEDFRDTAIREIFEELDVRVDPNTLIEIGESKEESDSQTWTSKVYLAPIYKVMKNKSCMHGFTEDIRQVVEQFKKDKGVAQIWTIRLLEYLDRLGGAKALRAILVSHGKMPYTGGIRLTEKNYPYLDLPGLLKQCVPEAYDYDDFKRSVTSKIGWCERAETELHLYWEARRKSLPNALPEVKMIKGFPDTEEDARILLQEIMCSDPEWVMSAQTLYHQFSVRGLPGTRMAKIKFMEKCQKWGIVTDVRYASGRFFKFKEKE